MTSWKFMNKQLGNGTSLKYVPDNKSRWETKQNHYSKHLIKFLIDLLIWFCPYYRRQCKIWLPTH